MSFHLCWCGLLNKLRNVTDRCCFKLTGVDIVSILGPFETKKGMEKKEKEKAFYLKVFGY